MIIRFIYAYKEVESKRAVYVGSTLDPHERHRGRKIRPCCPFDKELAAHPNAYVMSIVEAFRAETDEESKAVCVLRENQWMDVLNTFRTPHGFNFQRANIQGYNRDSWLAARQKAQTTPEAIARKVATWKATWERNHGKIKLRVKLSTEEIRRRQSEGASKNMKKLHADKAFAARLTKRASAQFKILNADQVFAAARDARSKLPNYLR